eukprot:CAMPEP_0196183096 /NCGR_PEP_ID=MMETSP0911-20130528/30950_1 /TAXON_ID=49265 /ORGANISM="Thalassiosira rotula, Strain GSO102" /LENGTH=32 /DNA_ID= /DNA_START= /DNA_END= /DNA_ORIENTATION=
MTSAATDVSYFKDVSPLQLDLYTKHLEFGEGT